MDFPYRQPVLRASQPLATSPCDAWNGRSVGNPGGGAHPRAPRSYGTCGGQIYCALLKTG